MTDRLADRLKQLSGQLSGEPNRASINFSISQSAVRTVWEDTTRGHVEAGHTILPSSPPPPRPISVKA